MSRLAAAALALALLGGAGGCRASDGGGTFERRGGAATRPGAAVRVAPPAVRVLHWGDAGEANRQQAAVAAGIAEAQRRKPFDLAFHAGDNLYDCGPAAGGDAAACRFAADGNTVAPGWTPPPDPSFHEKFERSVAPLASAGVPIYLVLGNHDVQASGRCGAAEPVAASRAKACLEVAHATAAWRMPARHYVVDRGPARFIVLDSDLVAADYGGFTLSGEAAFLSAASEGCDARLCFVVAHHPAATAGDHAEDFTPAYSARMERLVAAGGGRLRGWLAGHDHDLQHLRTAAGLDVFVSGNGARSRDHERFERAVPAGANLLYGSTRWGFAVLEVGPAGFTWRVEDERGTPRYCCAAARSAAWSPCEPVACG